MDPENRPRHDPGRPHAPAPPAGRRARIPRAHPDAQLAALRPTVPATRHGAPAAGSLLIARVFWGAGGVRRRLGGSANPGSLWETARSPQRATARAARKRPSPSKKRPALRGPMSRPGVFAVVARPRRRGPPAAPPGREGPAIAAPAPAKQGWPSRVDSELSNSRLGRLGDSANPAAKPPDGAHSPSLSVPVGGPGPRQSRRIKRRRRRPGPAAARLRHKVKLERARHHRVLVRRRRRRLGGTA